MKKGVLILAGGPLRERLRELARALEERRDAIADLDLEIEMLRERLLTFEQAYRSRMANEHAQLKRIESYVRVLDGWSDLLARRPGRTIQSQGARVDQRRVKDVKQSAKARAAAAAQKDPPLNAEVLDPKTLPAQSSTSREADLKAVYRRMARRFHPDLARTEDERLHAGHMMARINLLYRGGDLERLLALEEQTKGGAVDDDDAPIEEQTALLEARLAWFDTVLANLRDERIALEHSATCELFRNVEQANEVGRDLVEELRNELSSRVQRAYADVTDAAARLTRNVGAYNRAGATNVTNDVVKRDGGEVARIFDPYADKSLVRLGLDELATARVSRAAREKAERIEALADVEPTLLRLILLTYAAEQSPFPLAGLESYEHIAQRVAYLEEEHTSEGATLRSFEEALVELDTLLQFGVKSVTERVAYSGLRFTDADARMAVAVALQRASVRREMAHVLAVLGDYVRCSGCKKDVYAIPIYRTRGLDDLRSSVCPRCGTTQASYWMPKGKDVQAVLNPTYLDYELVTEWAFELAHLSIAMQLLPVQVDKLTVGELKKRFCEDTLERHQIEVTRGQVALYQGAKKVLERTRLSDLEERSFIVRFEDTKLRERDALELIRHRIRNRFK